MSAHRIKTYSGESGYVYQYYFLDSQPRKKWWTNIGIAFRFHVTSDRKEFVVIEVLLEEAAMQAWQRAHGRPLDSNEQYAAAKMRLFRAFDESETPEKIVDVRITDANIEALLEPLRLTD